VQNLRGVFPLELPGKALPVPRSVLPDTPSRRRSASPLRWSEYVLDGLLASLVSLLFLYLPVVRHHCPSLAHTHLANRCELNFLKIFHWIKSAPA